MNDRAISLLDQYDIEVARTKKGRGAVLCETDKGLLIFKEYNGNPEHLALQDALLRKISREGMVQAEELLPTREGELYVKDGDGVMYLLKTYLEGRECNIREREECLEAVRILAKLHLCTEKGVAVESRAFSVAEEYEKRNRELKRIRKYLRRRSQKTWFEISLLNCFDSFYEQALEASEGWAVYSAMAEEEGACALCHGDYQYHNILTDNSRWYTINYERCIRDNPIRDLHLLMRKLMEKTNWNESLGEDLLRTYEKIRPLSAVSRIDLYYRLSYPEKFCKIVNFYYNSGKAWISGRNQEKLEYLLSQEKEKKQFLEEVFRV